MPLRTAGLDKVSFLKTKRELEADRPGGVSDVHRPICPVFNRTLRAGARHLFDLSLHDVERNRTAWRNSMANLDMTLPEGAGDRLAIWLKTYYGANANKQIQRDFDAQPSTAKRWLSGGLPSGETILEMIRRWGPDFCHALVGDDLLWMHCLKQLQRLHIARTETNAAWSEIAEAMSELESE